MPGQVETGQAPVPGDAAVPHQPVELPPIRAGRVQAEQVPALARLFAMDKPGGAVRRDRPVEATDIGRLPLLQRRARDLRHWRGAAGGEPAADLQHPPRQVAVLREGQFLADDREFRHPHAQREEAVMVPRRDRLQNLGPQPCRPPEHEGRFSRRCAEGEIHGRTAALQGEADRSLTPPAGKHGIRAGRFLPRGREGPGLRNRPAGSACTLSSHARFLQAPREMLRSVTRHGNRAPRGTFPETRPPSGGKHEIGSAPCRYAWPAWLRRQHRTMGRWPLRSRRGNGHALSGRHPARSPPPHRGLFAR